MDQIPQGQPQPQPPVQQPQPQPQWQQQPQPPMQPQYAPPPSPPTVPPQPYYQSQQQPQPTQHEYQKLGGFLSVIVILGLIGAGRGVLMTFQELGSDIEYVSLLFTYGYGLQGIIFVVASVLSNISIVMTAVSMFFLLAKKSGFFLLFILSELITVVSILLLLVQTLSLSAEEVGLILMFALFIVALLQFVLYVLYFIKSVRVRTFMGTDAYITKNPLTRWAHPPLPAVPDPVST